MSNKRILKYNTTIDYLKGILILLVFLGHLVVGKMEENMLRHFIYSFHMPVFVGISGYLFNFTFLNNSSKQFIKKLFERILIPYIFANIFYSFFVNAKFILKLNFIQFIIEFLKDLIFSYYHLWYVQGYISYILISYLLLKLLNFNIRTLIIGLIVSLFIYYIYFFIKPENVFMRVFLNNFRIYNLIFFLIGCFIKEKVISIKINKSVVLISIGIFFMNSIIEFFITRMFDIYIYIKFRTQ